MAEEIQQNAYSERLEAPEIVNVLGDEGGRMSKKMGPQSYRGK